MADIVGAIQAETSDDPAGWTFGGHTFTLARKVDLRAIIFMQRGNFDRALQIILGVDQANQLLELDTDEALDDAAMTRLAETWAAANGTTVGESKASTDS